MPIIHEPDAAAHHKIDFYERLREALYALYDPVIIGASPLNGWLHLDRNSTPLALRQTLINAISALKPLESEPRNSKSWRIYNVLHQRFVGQWSQRKVALNLALSERQLKREEKSAIKALMVSLWTTYQVDQAWQTDSPPSVNNHNLDQQSHDLSDVEVQELKATASLVKTDIAILLDGVLATLKISPVRSESPSHGFVASGIPEVVTRLLRATARIWPARSV